LSGLLAAKPVVKHCFELHALILNLELLRAATRLGYKHIFHFRQDEAARIQSLFFALQVGVWHEGDANRLTDAMVRRRLADVGAADGEDSPSVSGVFLLKYPKQYRL